MSGRWNEVGAGGDSSQDFTQATQEEPALELDEYTQVEPLPDANGEDATDSGREAEPVPWGRLMRLSGGSAIALMPRPEQPQGRALNEVTLGRGKVCEVQVSDQRISSKHCRIYCETVSGHLGGMEVYVEDMSANGTWINQNTKLVRGQRRLLHSGDEIALLNPYKYQKRAVGGGPENKKDSLGRGRDDGDKLQTEAATFTFINLNRNRGGSNCRAGSFNAAETLRSSSVPGMSAPARRSGANGVGDMIGDARKVEDFYEVREMIGHGTSGEVRRAINRQTGKEVAVKVIETRKFALTPGLTPKELVQEAEMLKRVDHEYIIKLEDIFQTDQALYLVMDLVSGGDLFDRIVEKGVYAEDLAQELLFRVLTAVQYLHSQNIVHRDLKPENILLVGRENDVDVKITDFGLAKRANKEGLKTFCGTPQYFAPEVLMRRHTVLGVGRYGMEADMWSVGVILYILLSGTHPFHTNTLFDQISHASYSMQGAEWDHISDAAKDLVRKLLTENPKDRLTAEQALSHPFITERPFAKAATVSPTGTSAVTSKGEKGTTGEPPAPSSVSVSSAPTEGGGNGLEDGAMAGEKGLVAPGGQKSSQDTDLSSTSGAEDASPGLKSTSPSESGGRSAKGAPAGAGTGNCSRDTQPRTPRKGEPHLLPPHPREPGKGEGGGRAVGRGRRKQKRNGGAVGADNSPPAYSQLQMRVRAGVQDHGNGEESSEGINTMPAPAEPTNFGSNDGGGSAHWKAASRPRVAAQGNGRGARTPRSKRTEHASSRLDSPVELSTGRGNRKIGEGEHAPQCAKMGSSLGGDTNRPVPRTVAGRASGVAATKLPADDDIMEYSSDDSPAKGKRDRLGRGRGGGSSSARGQQATSRLSGSAAHAAATANPTSEVVSHQHDLNGSHQMHLKVCDSGKLDLSKLGPQSRAGTGSASSMRERSSGDRVAQAAAGGSAANLEDSVGGGAPAGSGDSSPGTTSDSKAGKGARKARESSKPQRTMTNLWGRARAGER